MTITLTWDAVLDAVKADLEEHGEDFVYQSPVSTGDCFYTTDEGAPSCMVGRIIHRIDPDALKRIYDEIEWGTGAPVDELQSVNVSSLTMQRGSREPIINCGEDLMAALQEAQEAQDTGFPLEEAAYTITAAAPRELTRPHDRA